LFFSKSINGKEILIDFWHTALGQSHTNTVKLISAPEEYNGYDEFQNIVITSDNVLTTIKIFEDD